MADVRTGVSSEQPLKCRDPLLIMDAAGQRKSCSRVTLEQGLFSAVKEKSMFCNTQIGSVGRSPQRGFIFSFPAELLSSPCRKAQCLATLGQAVLTPLERPQPGQDGQEWKSQQAEEKKQQHFVLVVVCFL